MTSTMQRFGLNGLSREDRLSLAEELWELLGHTTTLAYEPWPTWDEQHLIETEVEIPVQINGKLRDRVVVSSGADRAAIEAAVLASGKVQAALAGRTPDRIIHAGGKLVNLVVHGA